MSVACITFRLNPLESWGVNFPCIDLTNLLINLTGWCCRGVEHFTALPAWEHAGWGSGSRGGAEGGKEGHTLGHGLHHHDQLQQACALLQLKGTHVLRHFHHHLHLPVQAPRYGETATDARLVFSCIYMEKNPKFTLMWFVKPQFSSYGTAILL